MNTYIVKVPVVGEAEIVPFNKENSYKQLSDAVGGYIECAIIPHIKTTGKYGIDCFVNEEGLLNQLPLNPRLTCFASKSYGGPLVGDAVFVGHDSECETVGLEEDDAKAIAAMFGSCEYV